jgi:hypothetical protein
MPIRFGDIRTKTMPFSFSYETNDGPEVVHGTFTPNTFTPALAEEEAALSEAEQTAHFSAMLAKTLASWDVLEDNGSPYRTDEESLKKLGYHFLSAVFKALTESMKPGEENASSSANGSHPEEALVSAPNGTAIGY